MSPVAPTRDRSLLHLLALVVAACVALGLVAAPGLASSASAKPIKKIKAKTLGIHSFTSDPRVPAGSIRLSCAPTWRTVQPHKGQFKWAAMDASIERAEQWGFKDIQFVFCGTPTWAGGPVRLPSYEILGKYSTSAPTDMSYWTTFVTAVVKRYKGRIDTYQIWNEITSAQFYQGSSKKMAKMTKSASKIIRKNDSRAEVSAASVQTHRITNYDNVAVPYFKALKKKKWPVDILAGHFYPAGKKGPDARLKQIAMFNKTLNKLKAPKSKERWDTESNFYTSMPNNPPAGRVTGKKAATFLARNYLDTWRTGLTRSYWYLWSSDYVPFPGVQTRVGDSATKAYQTLGSWVKGAKYKGCDESGKLVTCRFKKGGKFTIAFTTKKSATYKFSGRKSVCPVTGDPCKNKKRKVKVKKLPVKIG